MFAPTDDIHACFLGQPWRRNARKLLEHRAHRLLHCGSSLSHSETVHPLCHSVRLGGQACPFWGLAVLPTTTSSPASSPPLSVWCSSCLTVIYQLGPILAWHSSTVTRFQRSELRPVEHSPAPALATSHSATPGCVCSSTLVSFQGKGLLRKECARRHPRVCGIGSAAS